ncbi:MAG: nicotinate-nicotinamide nucleotide adenylyltransferase [Planctomycetota bacterium]
MPEIEPLRAAVFGGSFDPVHEGHLEVARRAQSAFNLERVLFIPAAQPPHKLNRQLAEPHLRLAATLIATALEPSWEVLALELGRDGPSYTYDTLLEIPDVLRYRLVPKKDGGIAKRKRDLELFLIIGSDNLPGLPSWRNAEDIVALAQPIVIWRGPSEGDPEGTTPETLLEALGGQLSDAAIERICRGFLALEPYPMSSTEIRGALARGEVPRGAVDDEVLEFLLEHGMYGWPAEAENPFVQVPEPTPYDEHDIDDEEDDGFVDFEEEEGEGDQGPGDEGVAGTRATGGDALGEEVG